MLTPIQYQILSLALGVPLATKLPKRFYRNRLIVGDRHRDITTLRQLEEMELVTSTDPIAAFDGDRWWEVTPLGISAFVSHFLHINNPLSCAV